MTQEKIGKITVGAGTDNKRSIEVINRLTCLLADNRKISVSKLEEGEGYLLTVGNPKDSGRGTAYMLLTETSFKGLAVSIMLYFLSEGIEINNEIGNIVGSDEFNYLAQNLKDPFKNEQ